MAVAFSAPHDPDQTTSENPTTYRDQREGSGGKGTTGMITVHMCVFPAAQANRRVAVYPVEVVADAEEHDDTYAVALYIYYAQGPRGEREAVPGVTGIPTEASLARTRSKRV